MIADIQANLPSPLYIFLDEGGDLNFAPNGSKYFTMASVAARRPFPWGSCLPDLRFDLIQNHKLSFERFHASEDSQATRDEVFRAIRSFLPSIRIDSVIVEKCKTGPALRDVVQFYPRMLGYLLRFVLGRFPKTATSDVIVITDTLPVNKKRKAIEKSVKETIAKMLPADASYRVLHQSSTSCCGLQVADYCNWAIYRQWSLGDRRSLDLIGTSVRSQFDIFRTGTIRWY